MVDPNPANGGRRRPHRSFGLVVSTGLAGAVLTAVAGTRDWARASGVAAGIPVDAASGGSEVAPLATSLALLALAAWGVMLVTRGRVRRAVSAVGFAAAVGTLAAVVVASARAQGDARAALAGLQAPHQAVASLTGWYYLTGAAALVTALAFIVAFWRSPGWPAMGSRYDAPSARADTSGGEKDMWRALDQGRDPTS